MKKIRAQETVRSKLARAENLINTVCIIAYSEIMTLGGRPKDGPGHRPFNMSLREDLYGMLKKVREPNRSNFIERTIGPVLEKLDPGTACEFLWEIDETARKHLLEAHNRGDYAQAMAIDTIMHDLEDYRALCSEGADRKRCEDRGGKWESGTCTVEGHY